ncbi:MAG: thioesterase family protein [Nitrospirae bacterium]|nr:thioesterase family protein [Nitrospirota bacterium]
MNLLFRMLKVLLAAVLGSRLAPLGESVVAFRVWPNDLDTNLHMNNGRYLTLMDLGRLDLMIRAGLGPVIVRRRWRPMVGTAVIRFRRGLAPFERYDLKTRIVSWDEKWFWIEQRFERGGELVAVGAVKGLFRNPTGNVPTAEVLDVLGVTEAPQIPDWILAWQRADAGTVSSMAAEPPHGRRAGENMLLTTPRFPDPPSR